MLRSMGDRSTRASRRAQTREDTREARLSVGPHAQASIPALGEPSRFAVSPVHDVLVWAPDESKPNQDELINAYLLAARQIYSDLPSTEPEAPFDHQAHSLTNPDDTGRRERPAFAELQALTTLYFCDYDVEKALGMLRDQLTNTFLQSWSVEERLTFDQLIDLKGKNFAYIQRMMPRKTMKEIAEYYECFRKSATNVQPSGTVLSGQEVGSVPKLAMLVGGVCELEDPPHHKFKKSPATDVISPAVSQKNFAAEEIHDVLTPEALNEQQSHAQLLSPTVIVSNSERRSRRPHSTAAVASSILQAPQLTKRNDICRRLSDTFFFWARLEAFLLAICSTAIGLLLYYEFWWGSFLTYPFYRAVSPFELQSYVREMEQFMGSTDVERINILLRTRHVSEIEAEQFSRFLWQPDFCDIRYRTCTTLMQSPVHTKSSHHWVTTMLQQSQRAAKGFPPQRNITFFPGSLGTGGVMRPRTPYTAVIIGHLKSAAAKQHQQSLPPALPPLPSEYNNIWVPSWSVLYGVGSRTQSRAQFSATGNNSPNRRAFLCMRCTCQQPVSTPTTALSTSSSSLTASAAVSSPPSSTQPQPQPQLLPASSVSAAMSALRAVPAANLNSLYGSSLVSKQRLLADLTANDLMRIDDNENDLSSPSNSDDFVINSGAIAAVDDMQSPSFSSSNTANVPTVSILQQPKNSASLDDHHVGTDQYASFSAGSGFVGLAPVTMLSHEQQNLSADLHKNINTATNVGTVLFQASVNNNNINVAGSLMPSVEKDDEADDEDEEQNVDKHENAEQRKRQFCFLWPQYPGDLYIHNTAQLMQNPVGGSAHDDTSEFWLDTHGNLKMFVGIFQDDVAAAVSSSTFRLRRNSTGSRSDDKKYSSPPEIFFEQQNGTMVNISIVRWTKYYNRWKCTERTLHNMLQRWRENVFMPWHDWSFHMRCNPLFMVFGKLFQLPFDLAIHWVFKLIFMAFLLKLCGNALLFAILDPHCRVGWRQRMFYLTYPVSIPMNVAMSFSLMVMTYFFRECWEWSNVDELAHPYLDQFINIVPAVSLVYFVLAIFWVSTMAARQNPTQGWWFCVNIRKFMMKGPKELTSFFLTVVNIRGGSEDEQELRMAHICRLGDDDLICLICHETLDRDTLVRYPGEVPILECRHIYHSACLTQWLVKSEKCPYCQEKVRLSRETLRRLYPRTRRFRIVVWLVANISHRIGSSVYGMVARCICEAFRDCCCICRIWTAFFSYFLAVFFILLTTRRLSAGSYDLFVYQSIEQYVRTECR